MAKSLRTYGWYLLAVTCWATVCFIVPDYLDQTVSTWRSILTLAAYAAVLGVVPFLLFTVLCANKYVAAVCLPVYAILGSGVAYYAYNYHVLLTARIVDVTLHTNAAEASGVIAWPLIVFVVINLLIAVLFVVWRWKMPPTRLPYLIALIGLIGLPIYVHVLHGKLIHHYPLNIYASLSEYHYLKQQRRQPYEQIPAVLTDSVPTDSLQVVVVIGEATRADHMSLYGYARATNPRMQARSGVIALPYVYSPYTYTLGSVPYMITPADSLHAKWANNKESFIAYYADQGFRTAWLSNSDMGETYVHYMYSADTLLFAPMTKYEKSVDAKLLPLLREALCRTDATTGKGLYVLHTIGSHWYYDTYLPDDFAPFTPTLSNRIITQNTPEQIINSYDNTVAYADLFLDSVISMLQDRPAILFYQSDHGESLGENGQWLHASDADELHYPAALIWYSERFGEIYPATVSRLQAMAQQPLTTAYLFPAVLSVIGLQTTEQ